MTVSPVMFQSDRVKWGTPTELYAKLDAEFGFDLDPCPLDWSPDTHPDGLKMSWAGRRVYCNPPYGRGVGEWLAKAHEAHVAVYLLPARTDTRWWHEQVEGKVSEIRFMRGRVKFQGAQAGAPFPTVIVVYRKGGSHE